METTGTIVAFGGPKDNIPNGWVACDGTLYDRTVPRYTALFNVIGVSWGGDGAEKFAVPDLRGLFLRGVSEVTTVDPEKDDRGVSRVDLNAQGNRGNGVGSKQMDQFRSHSHPYVDHAQPAHNTFESGDERGLGDHAKTTSSAGGSETRPKNAYVYFIIKL